jgi:hypothetical protein
MHIDVHILGLGHGLRQAMAGYALLHRWNDLYVPAKDQSGPKITQEVLIRTALVICSLDGECFREYVVSLHSVGIYHRHEMNNPVWRLNDDNSHSISFGL